YWFWMKTYFVALFAAWRYMAPISVTTPFDVDCFDFVRTICAITVAPASGRRASSGAFPYRHALFQDFAPWRHPMPDKSSRSNIEEWDRSHDLKYPAKETARSVPDRVRCAWHCDRLCPNTDQACCDPSRTPSPH